MTGKADSEWVMKNPMARNHRWKETTLVLIMPHILLPPVMSEILTARVGVSQDGDSDKDRRGGVRSPV
jgi:hypothetical protein